jgi:hypothetical protein
VFGAGVGLYLVYWTFANRNCAHVVTGDWCCGECGCI